jgi:hypothetical protein
VFARLTARRWLVVICSLYLVAAASFAVSAPLLDVSDEPRHFAFLHHLANGGALPVQQRPEPGKHAETPWHQEGSQPPLYYGAMSLVARLFDRSDFDAIWRFNPHTQGMGRADATYGRNQMLHGSADAFPWSGTAAAVMAIRFVSLCFGLVAVVCTFGVARAIGLGDTIALFAAALTAFNPMFAHIMASVNNDTLATALASIALLLGARMVMNGVSTARLCALGVVLGCAALTKVSALALVGAIPPAILAAEWHRHGFRAPRLLGIGLTVAVPVFVIAGWFYLRNWQLYGEPTGTQMMAAIAGPRERPPTALELIGEWRGFMQAYIGLFGAVNIPLPVWIYELFQLLLIASGAGLVLAAARAWMLPVEARIALGMLAAVVLIAFVALLRWTSMTLASQGRLLFPTIAALTTLLALGLHTVIARLRMSRFAHVALAGASAALAALTLASPFVVLRPAYARPERLASERALPADMIPKELYFGDQIRWVGYRVDTPRARVAPGDTLDLTLYWQALKPIDTDYSVFINVFGHGDMLLSGNDTYPGGGLFQTTLWAPGEIIVDRYRLRLDATARATLATQGPTALTIDVGFYDLTRGTGDRPEAQLPTFDAQRNAIGRPRTEVASINDAPSVADAPPIARLERAEVIAVQPVTMTARADALPVNITWRAAQDFTDDYVVFAQLFDANGRQVGAGDGPAVNGIFGARWWRSGDVVREQRIIKFDASTRLLRGRYTLRYGLYRPVEPYPRMPAADSTGARLKDDAIEVVFDMP